MLKRQLRIGAAVWEPIVARKCSLKQLLPSPACREPGADAENLGFLLNQLNVSYELVPFDNNSVDWGTLQADGHYSGLLGLVEKGFLDTISATYMRTNQRARTFEFSYPMEQYDCEFIAARTRPGFFYAMTQVFRVFGPLVWTALALSIVAIASCLLLIMRCAPDRANPQKLSFVEMLWRAYRITVSQVVTEWRFRLASANMLITWLCFSAVLVVGLYQCMLLAQLLHPPDIPPFDGADQLIESLGNRRFKLVTYPDWHWYTQELHTADTLYYRRMREALQQGPGEKHLTTDNLTHILTLVATGEYITAGINPDSISTEAFCNLVRVPGPFVPTYPFGYVFRKRDPFVRRLSRAAIYVQEHSSLVLDRYMEKYGNQCKRSAQSSSQYAETPLTLLSTAGVFILYVMGCAFGAATLLIEAATFKYRLYRLQRIYEVQVQPEA